MWKVRVVKDRRRAQRVTTRHLAKYRLIDPSGKSKQVISVSKNVSATGLQIQSKEPLEAGKHLELEINFPPFKDSIKAQVKVVWARKLKNRDYYKAGLSFVNIDKEYSRRIIDYIEYVNTVSRNKFLLSQLKNFILKLFNKK